MKGNRTAVVFTVIHVSHRHSEIMAADRSPDLLTHSSLYRGSLNIHMANDNQYFKPDANGITRAETLSKLICVQLPK
jgi:hypothetical protein